MLGLLGLAVGSVTSCRGASTSWVGSRAAICYVLFLSVKICPKSIINPYPIKANYSSLSLHNREDALKKWVFPNACFASAELFHNTNLAS